jgi:hypothetical protein
MSILDKKTTTLRVENPFKTLMFSPSHGLYYIENEGEEKVFAKISVGTAEAKFVVLDFSESLYNKEARIKSSEFKRYSKHEFSKSSATLYFPDGNSFLFDLSHESLINIKKEYELLQDKNLYCYSEILGFVKLKLKGMAYSELFLFCEAIKDHDFNENPGIYISGLIEKKNRAGKNVSVPVFETWNQLPDMKTIQEAIEDEGVKNYLDAHLREDENKASEEEE